MPDGTVIPAYVNFFLGLSSDSDVIDSSEDNCPPCKKFFL